MEAPRPELRRLTVAARRLARRLRPAAAALSRAGDAFVGSVPAWYPWAFAFATIGFLVAWPIIRSDTDLWYHLNTGRWILEHRALPASSDYFSFLSPPRLYRDYFWMFQVLVYSVFERGGYLGLVLLRACLVAAFAAGLAAFLFTGTRRGPWPVAVFVTILSAVIPRSMVLRPHLIEYVCIVAFLFILERRPSWTFLLPFLAVGWGNFHGVSYPILLAICGAYILERLVSPRSSRLSERDMAFAAVAMAAVFLTPLGHTLVDMPFVMDDRQKYLIGELQPLKVRRIFAFHLEGGAPVDSTWFNVVLWTGLLCALGRAVAGRVRLPHFILFVVGLALLPRGFRFQYEMAMLALPMLLEPPFEPIGLRWPASRLIAIPALLIMPFVSLAFTIVERPLYPVFHLSLPRGVSDFLMKEGGGGKVLNRSDVGGYYGWRLSPLYRIAIDMQPFPDFADHVFLQSRWFRDPEALRPMIERYHPEFIAAKREGVEFRDVIKKFPDYVPVFFDDEDILFASRGLRPELVRRWVLPVDPYEIPRLEPAKLVAVPGRRGCTPLFLARMLDVDPTNLIARISAGHACLERGDAAAAEAHARAALREYPDQVAVFEVLGKSLEKAGRLWEAVEAYNRQLKLGAQPRPVHARLSAVYQRLGMRSEAEEQAQMATPEIDPAAVSEALGLGKKANGAPAAAGKSK